VIARLSVLFLVGLPAIAVAQPAELTLQRALDRGDRIEAGRQADKLGDAWLIAALEGPAGRSQTLAVAVAPYRPSLQSAEALATLLARSDSEAVGRALVGVAGQLTDRIIDSTENASYRATRLQQRLLALATTVGQRPRGRVDALEAAQALAGSLGETRVLIAPLEASARQLLDDQEATVRAFALELLATRGAFLDEIQRRVQSEPKAEVAAAGAVGLCSHLASSGAGKLAPIAARIRTVASDDGASASTRLSLLPCLRLLGSPADRALQQKLRRLATR
jgi:hypothetical protein